MSYDGSVLVTFQAIEQAQSDVNTTVSSINSQMDDLKTYLQPIISTWVGSARDGYVNLQTQWNGAATDLNTVLAQIGNALGDAHQNYLSTESANAGTWG